MKKILIAGADSYLGTSFEGYLAACGDNYVITTTDMTRNDWKSLDLSEFHTIYFVAGIVHVKKKIDPELYYRVNRDLPVEMAKEAKRQGAGSFVFVSTMSVYGDDEGVIQTDRVPQPKSHYGISKYQAEQAILPLDCPQFKVFILRPPMVYGKGCKGNYNTLASFVKKFGVFPDYPNQRSMIYIDNLNYFVKSIVDGMLDSGVWTPQNREYVNTSHMAKLIGEANGKKIRSPRIFNPIIRLMKAMKIEIAVKCFGSYRYSADDERNLVDHVPFELSIQKTEER